MTEDFWKHRYPALEDLHNRAMDRLASTPKLVRYAETLAPEQADYFNPYSVAGVEYPSYDMALAEAPVSALIALAQDWEMQMDAEAAEMEEQWRRDREAAVVSEQAAAQVWSESLPDDGLPF